MQTTAHGEQQGLRKGGVCAGGWQVRDLVRALMEVAQADHAMAADVWVLVFPIVWATLSERKQQQVDLAKPIISLLSREYHMRQAHLRPNVVQARSPCLSSVALHATRHQAHCRA